MGLHTRGLRGGAIYVAQGESPGGGRIDFALSALTLFGLKMPKF